MFIDRTTIILFNFTEMTTLIIHIYVMLLCVRDSVKDLTHYLIECSQQFYEVDIIITCISQIKKKNRDGKVKQFAQLKSLLVVAIGFE